MNCHDCFLVIDEYHDGELDAHAAHVVAIHLRACAECREIYEALRFEQTEIYANYERPVEVTSGLWSAVQERIAVEQAIIQNNSLTRFKRWCASVLFVTHWQQSQFVAAAAAVVLIAASLFGFLRTPRLTRESSGYRVVALLEGSGKAPHASGRFASGDTYPTLNEVDSATMPRVSESDYRRPDVTARSATFVKAASATKRERAFNGATRLEAASTIAVDAEAITDARFSTQAEERREVEFDAAEHIRRAELLLRFFRNIDPLVRGSIGEVARERRQSRRLLFDNILLRRSAVINGNVPVAEVLGSVEPLLIDIANLPDRPSPSDINLIKNRIQRKEMVATLQAHHTLAAAAATTSFGY